jgi:hypothetical protein
MSVVLFGFERNFIWHSERRAHLENRARQRRSGGSQDDRDTRSNKNRPARSAHSLKSNQSAHVQFWAMRQPARGFKKLIDYAFRRFGAIDSYEISDELQIVEGFG